MSSASSDHVHDSAYEEDPGALAPPKVVEVADHVFAYVQPDGTWWINNAGFVVGDELVVSIDTCSTEARTRAYLGQLESRTGGRHPDLLVNTHHHGDHTNGNCLLPSATIVGHEKCREEMLASGILRVPGIWDPVDWGELTLAPPFVTFSDRLDLHAGDLLVELHHLGTPAHTTNDVIAWLPEQRVLFSGDLLFNGGTPFVMMGSVRGALAALERLVEFAADVVVPGHGEVCDLGVVRVVRDYLAFVEERAAAGKAAGLAPLDLARQTDLGDFAGLTDSERLVGNLHRAYAELEGLPLGAPIDLVSAITDMVAFNGGRPLRCRA
jgi:cyclase